MEKPAKNFAFIDSQNVNLGVQALGWKMDWRPFCVYLGEKYGAAKAVLFIGYIPENQALYTALQQAGFILVFKPVLQAMRGEPKGNIDADLVLKAMTEFANYERALIVTGDGDFYSLVDYLSCPMSTAPYPPRPKDAPHSIHGPFGLPIFDSAARYSASWDVDCEGTTW